MNVAEFLRKTRLVLEDLDRLRAAAPGVKLHAAARPGRFGQEVLSSLGPPGQDQPVRERLMSLPGRAADKLLKDYGDAGSEARAELLRKDGVRLFSIIAAIYRPGPAFGAQHALAEARLAAVVAPGGPTWREQLGQLGFLPASEGEERTWIEIEAAIARVARQTVRLDTRAGSQAGSGFLHTNGLVLTAGHVVHGPGWLYGNPPAPTRASGQVRYNVVDSDDAAAGPNVLTPAFSPAAPDEVDMAVVRQESAWDSALSTPAFAKEFGHLRGLELSEEIPVCDLAGRQVAVIGHPRCGNTGGSAEDIPKVFGDAALGLKRFMPGLLDAEKPLVGEGHRARLQHDCSTLGGASGSCLLDLRTGKVLGIHVSGNATLANNAVPAWVVKAKLKEFGVG